VSTRDGLSAVLAIALVLGACGSATGTKPVATPSTGYSPQVVPIPRQAIPTTVGTNRVVVPGAVLGMPEAQAETILAQRGLHAAVQPAKGRTNPPTPKGVVISVGGPVLPSTWAAGDGRGDIVVPGGSTVTLIVSIG
jgi:hypothetical protein